MKFSEMKYERLNKEQLKKDMLSYIEAFSSSKTFEEANKCFIEFDKISRHVDTMATLASIRNSINTKDEFYEKEMKFWNETFPELEEYSAKWSEALLSTAFRAELTKEYGDIIFKNAEIDKKAFSPEIISLMQEENDLTLKYDKLIASAEIEFEGKTYNISQMQSFQTDADDARRLEAWKSTGRWYSTKAEELDDIYDRLVKNRDEQGRKLGYKDYLQLGYYRMKRNCYDKNDVEKFRKAVREYLVPVAEKIRKDQAKRLEVDYPMSFSDSALMFRSGNPRPVGGVAEVVAAGKKFYDELSPETSEFFNKMISDELMDLESKDGKRAGGYMTNLFDYDVPFIFANFNGSQHDVEVITHEAGHAFAGYINRNRVPLSENLPTMEACEVHSMSMEFFAESHAGDFFGKDAEKYLYSHLAEAIVFIPYGTLVDHYQHIVYENPSLTPSQRHEEWIRLQKLYMPWIRLDGEIPFFSEGKRWQAQLHIYNSPLYYIDYCLAQTVALSFWAMIKDDVKNAWRKYMAYSRLGGAFTFTELLGKAGLDTPFGDKMLKEVCEKALLYLDKFDFNKIK